MSKKTYQSHERICTGRLEGRLTTHTNVGLQVVLAWYGLVL